MKIAVLLPVAYKGGVLNSLINIARMICTAGKKDIVEVVVGIPDGKYNIEQDFVELINLGINIREFVWAVATREEVENALYYQGKKKNLPYEIYQVPEDGVANFCDCEYWFLVTDRTELPLAPIKPFGVLPYDYIQRYVPSIFEGATLEADFGFIATARLADTVFATQPATLEDAVQYCGINRARACLLPLEFDPINLMPEISDIKKPYIIWTTNTTQHKNHLNTLAGLEYYYNELEGELDVVISGTHTQWFSQKIFRSMRDLPSNHISRYPYIDTIREYIDNSATLKKHIIFKGLMNKQEYVTTLASAKFLLHTAIYDNGTYSVLEAAYYGIPSLSSDYPQMQFLDTKMNLNLTFFNFSKPHDLAKKIKQLESKKTTLPNKKSLDSYSWENLAQEFWDTLKGKINMALSK